jgi:nucleotide-binding universal stress UspA family protein
VRPWRVIVCPVDFSLSGERAVDAAAHVAAREGARLILLHVTDAPAGLPADLRVLPDDGGPPVSAAQYARTTALRELERCAAPLRSRGIAVESKFAAGPVVQTILAVLRHVGADLVVMGTHGRTGLAHAILGSVAERVLRLSPVPVLTVRLVDGDEAHATEAEARLDAERDG